MKRNHAVLDPDFDDDHIDERPHVGARYRKASSLRPELPRRDLTQAAHLLSKGYIIGQE